MYKMTPDTDCMLADYMLLIHKSLSLCYMFVSLQVLEVYFLNQKPTKEDIKH